MKKYYLLGLMSMTVVVFAGGIGSMLSPECSAQNAAVAEKPAEEQEEPECFELHLVHPKNEIQKNKLREFLKSGGSLKKFRGVPKGT